MSFLDSVQSAYIMQRFPAFELSYEIISHKKVGNNYNTCLAIPYGKKAFLWMTYFNDNNVCLLMELGRDNKVGRIQIVSDEHEIPCDLAYGTILYGTMYKEKDTDSNPIFVVEDILFYCGISIAKLFFSEKLGFLDRFFCEFSDTLSKLIILNIALPVMWKIDPLSSQIIPSQWANNRIPYTIHHFQYRSLTQIMPYVNIKYKLEENTTYAISNMDVNKTHIGDNSTSSTDIFISPHTPQYDFRKPQYNEKTLFEICADRYADIYHLYAFSNTAPTKNRAYYGLAYIPNYNTSVFMNGIFRNIKENRNLDSIEESDDEDDFQDTNVDKYVDLNKRVIMECVFQSKFKRWIPVSLINNPQRRIVPIHRLIRTYDRDITPASEYFANEFSSYYGSKKKR